MINAATTLRKQIDAWKRERATVGAYKAVFTSAQGDIVLRDLMIQCGLLSVSHVSGDSHDTAFNEGKRAVVLFILERLRWSEPELMKLAAEQTGFEHNAEPSAGEAEE